MASMSWTLGAFIGPVLSGYLAEHVGYYEMSTVIGESMLTAWHLRSEADLGSRRVCGFRSQCVLEP